MLTKVDQLINKFEEFKEELNKNMNGLMNPGQLKPSATTGTSGGQTGMYRSEMDKNCAPPATMNMSEGDDVEKQMIGASPGGAQDMMVVKFDKNGQWRMEKAATEGKPANTHMGHSVFNMEHVHEIMGTKDHAEAKAKAHSIVDASSANAGNKAKIKAMIDASKSPTTLAQGMSNHILAHPSEGLKVVKADRVEWKKSVDLAKGIIEKLEKHFAATDGKNREANPKLRQSEMGPGGKVHMIQVKKGEGTNSEAATSKPHNKEKFKVMPMASEKEVAHLDAKGLPYDGKDKCVKKDEECSECHKDPCTCVDKSQKGHIQGNNAKGFDENKAPGRGTLTV
jgi:hypothetical protein